jgi:hypothetical protein
MSYWERLVDSSNIERVGYDSATRELLVVFRQSRKVYRYKEVPEEHVQQMLAASSVGSYFAKYIREAYICSGPEPAPAPRVFDYAGAMVESRKLLHSMSDMLATRRYAEARHLAEEIRKQMDAVIAWIDEQPKI